MADITVYHNPKCSKSRGAVEILRERGVEFDVVEYIKSPPSESDIRRIVKLLAVEPAEMLHEGSFKKLGKPLSEVDSDEAVVALLLEHPEVMQRPIVVRGERAVIGRPSENVAEILD